MFRMSPRMSAASATIASLALASCANVGGTGAADAGSPKEAYEVERSSAGDVETVRTVSGSLWGDAAILVEEISIGEEFGQDAYLFGNITSAWATEDRIYVVDAQVPAVRAFDGKGEYLFDIGNPGQGPGEYGNPSAVAVTSDGRVLISDAMSARINVYDAEGGLLEDWPLSSQKSALGLVLGHDEKIYTQSWSLEQARLGIQAVSPEGLIGEILFPPPIEFRQATVPIGKGMEMILPFAPSYTWAFAPGGEMIAGAGEQYRFEVHRPNGKASAIERDTDPAPVDGNEAEFHAHLATSSLSLMMPDGRINRGDIPEHKPAFSGFYADRSGRVWVVRQGPGRMDPECAGADEAASPRLMKGSFETRGKPGNWDDGTVDGECWADTYTFDIFDLSTGDFLATVDAPETGFRVPLFVEDDTVLAAVADELGTVRLKKYRLQND
jgi:hypothetical protein